MRLRFIFLVLLLPGCATTYGPSAISGGYKEIMLQDGVFKIIFNGNAYVGRDEVQFYALTRAAELTIEKGGRFFRILGGDDRVTNTNMVIPGYSSTYGTANAMATTYGNSVYGTATGTSTSFYMPPQTVAMEKPTSTLVVALLSRKEPGSLDAVPIIESAVQQKLKVNPNVVARAQQLRLAKP